MKFQGRVRRFLLIPICTVEDEYGDAVREERMKPITVFSGNVPDLKEVAHQLEVKVNREYFSKLDPKASKDRRSA